MSDRYLTSSEAVIAARLGFKVIVTCPNCSDTIYMRNEVIKKHIAAEDLSKRSGDAVFGGNLRFVSTSSDTDMRDLPLAHHWCGVSDCRAQSRCILEVPGK